MLDCNEEAQGASEDRRVESYACLLEPGKRPGQDPVYTGTRRLLLCRKARAGQLQRHNSSRRGDAMVEATLPIENTCGNVKTGKARVRTARQAILETVDGGHL